MQQTEQIIETSPIIGNVRIHFGDTALQMYELYQKVKEFERQKRIKHLGLIASVYEGTTHTRYEYLMLQCALADLADNNFKGTTSAQGSLKINSKEYLGNSILKTWFLLSNFGHAFNTIGDEKTLLLHCNESKAFRRKLLGAIKDEDLRMWAEDIIRQFDYVNFHHILSLKRIHKHIRN